jgi:nickel transport protein
MIKKMLGWSLGLLFLTGTLHAHDIWLQTHGDHLELLYGDGLPEVYNPAKVKEFAGYDKKGRPVTLQRIVMDDAFALAPEPRAAMITIAFDNGYWVQTSSAEWRNMMQDVARTFSSYRHPMLFHKSIYEWSRAVGKPIRYKMELVLLKNPFTKHKPTDTFPVQVYFDGKPLPHVEVQYGAEGGKTLTVKTNAKGKADVPFVKRSVQYFAVHYTPSATSGPENDTYTASLRFELKS